MDYAKRLEELRVEAALKSHLRQARKDLDKMYQNCRKTCDELSRESVECRRLKRVTQKYTEIEARLQEQIKHYEQWIFFAKLRF
jgi:hypothetical protein